MVGRIAGFFGRQLENFLNAPLRGFKPLTTGNPAALARSIRPADILLVEGNSRVSSAIKYLTQSTWSHAALYVGPIPGHETPEGEPHVLVEALLGLGVVSAPLSAYAIYHTRICRPKGLTDDDARRVSDFAIDHLGDDYDTRNVVDLARFLLPAPPVPMRMRRRMLALGAGSPTRMICSTLIAQAFASVRFPILPMVETVDALPDRAGADAMQREIFHIRHHSLYTPRDFDISPYFSVVKPTLDAGFDYRAIEWAPGVNEPVQQRNTAAREPALSRTA